MRTILAGGPGKAGAHLRLRPGQAIKRSLSGDFRR